MCSLAWLTSQPWVWINKFAFDLTLFKTKQATNPEVTRVWLPIDFPFYLIKLTKKLIHTLGKSTEIKISSPTSPKCLWSQCRKKFNFSNVCSGLSSAKSDYNHSHLAMTALCDSSIMSQRQTLQSANIPFTISIWIYWHQKKKKLGPLQSFVGKEQKTRRSKDTRLTGVSLQEQFIELKTDRTNLFV